MPLFAGLMPVEQFLVFLHALKTANSGIQVYAVEADRSAILSGEKPEFSQNSGISAGFIPDTLDTNAYDAIARVTSDDALTLGREIGGKKDDSLLVFLQLHGAIEVAKRIRYRSKRKCSCRLGRRC